MNTYEMVERIIELTEKGKIGWHDWVVNYQGWYKGMHLVAQRRKHTIEATIKINNTFVNVGKEQINRLQRAIAKSIVGLGEGNRSRKLQEADDILRG